MEFILYCFLYLIACLVVSFIGHARRITGTISFLLSATLSPFVGLIITLISPSLKSDKAYQKNSESNKVRGIISYVLSGLIILSSVYSYFTNKRTYSYDFTSNNNWASFIIGIGFYILGDYLCRMNIPDRSAQKNMEIENKAPLIPKKSLKQFAYFLLIVIGLFIITNPGIKRFKEYKESASYEGLKKEKNWILFSFYEDNNGERYLGILYNFLALD